MPPSLLEQLRNATGEDHRRLDRQVLAEGQPWTVDRYAWFLAASLAVVERLEPAVARTLGATFEPGDPTVRRDRLAADLAALGREPGCTRRLTVPSIETAADAFGAAYVLQGSMLGGAVIKRTLERELGLDSRYTSYFDLHHASLGLVWKRFTHALDDFGGTACTAGRQRAVAAARATFAAYRTALMELS